MSIKNVYLKKKIDGVVYDIYPHTDAALVNYTKGSGQDVTQTTVADELAALATNLSGVITSEQVDAKITTARNALYNQIMGLTGEEGETIAEAYDTLKEIADYLAGDGGAAATLASLATTVNDANTGLTKRVGDLETTVGDASSGLVKDVADNASDISALQTTVGDDSSGLVKDVADLQSTTGGVYVVSTVPVTADENSLYIVVDE